MSTRAETTAPERSAAKRKSSSQNVKSLPFFTQNCEYSTSMKPDIFPNWFQRQAAALALGAVYFITAKFGLSLDAVSGFAAFVWPPTGISLAALLIFGSRLWPGVWLGAFLANASTGAPFLTSCGIAAGNTLEALIGVYLVRRFVDFRHTMDRLKDVFALVVCAAGLSTLVSASMGVTSLYLSGIVKASSFIPTWWAWWVGDVMGDLIMAPFLLVWSEKPGSRAGKAAASGILHAVVVSMVFVLMCLVIFARFFPVVPVFYLRPYLLFPVLFWITLNFGQRGGITAVFVMSVIAVSAAVQGVLTLYGETLVEKLAVLETFLGTAALTSLVFGAVVSERRRAGEELQDAHDHLEKQVQERMADLSNANQKLEKEQEHFRAVAETAHNAFVSADGRGNIVFWNRAAEAIFGYSASEAIGQPLTILMPERFQQAHREGFQRFLATGESRLIGKTIELTGKRKDGSEVPIEISLSTWSSHEGVFFTGILRDITERKQTEKRFKDFLESAPDAMVIVNERGEIVLVNSRTESLFGYVREELIGKTVELLIPGRFRGAHLGYRLNYFSEPSARPMGVGLELYGLRKDGSEFPVEISLSPIRTEEGTLVTSAIRDITERKRAGEQLKKSEKLFAEAQEIGHVGSWEWDIAADKVSWSDALYRIYGLSPQSFHATYQGFLDRVHPDDRAFADSVVQKAFQEGTPFSFDHRIVLPGGEVRWLHGRGEVFLDAQGKPFRMAGTGQDITERRKTEDEIKRLNRELEQRVIERTTELFETHQELRDEVEVRKHVQQALSEGEVRYRTLVETSPYAIVLTGLDTHVIFANRQAAMMHGFDNAEQMIGKNAFDFIAPEDRPRAMDNAEKTLQTGSVRDIEYTLLRTDGSRFPAQVSATLILDAENKPKAFLGVVRDITNQKKAERRLRFLGEASRILASSLDYEATLKSVARLAVPDTADWCAVDIATDQGEVRRLAVTHVNPDKVKWAYELQRRYPPDPNAPRGVHHVLRTGKSEMYPDIPDSLLAESAVDSEHLQILRELGLRSAMIVPMMAHGRTLGAITFVSDAPERRYGPDDLHFAEEIARRAAVAVENARLYRKAHELNLELENRVRERTAQLETVNAELEAFSYSVSHDLRAPLRAILGFSRILMEEHQNVLNDGGKQVLNRICQNTKNMEKLIEDLLDFAHLGRRAMEQREVNMDEIVKGASKELKSILQGKNFRLVAKKLPPAVGDAAMLRHVFINLLSNSIKFTLPHASPSIEVGGERNGSQNTYYVKDRGVGFDMQYVDKLFGVFQRLHSAEEFEGTGVGLAIVKRIVLRHGGKVWAEGKVNGGAAFYFTLPGTARREKT